METTMQLERVPLPSGGALKKARTWALIHTDTLRANAAAIKELLPGGCSVMAVVKANAYGHGLLEVSTCLNRAGIRDFAVATLEEGIRLRQGGVTGNILILGYTPASLAGYLREYGLAQTVADALHGWQLAKTGLPLDVHLKIDTGMHRLGIPANRPEEILPLMTIPTLRVTGLFTHLCAADSSRPEDVAFTRGQIGDFFELTRQLSARGIPLPALHVQSSYGILRYPGLPCRFARPGILLYGCLSNPETMGEIPASIRPVLSWHSRIVLTRQIPEGDTVGYGRSWQARGPRRLAVIPVGYGDGYPRSLSNCHEVLICGQRAPIAGRICMDQMMADITHIPQAHCGSLVTLIGEQEEGHITAEETAARAGTIANELLCRLGDRIRRVTCP